MAASASSDGFGAGRALGERRHTVHARTTSSPLKPSRTLLPKRLHHRSCIFWCASREGFALQLTPSEGEPRHGCSGPDDDGNACTRVHVCACVVTIWIESGSCTHTTQGWFARSRVLSLEWIVLGKSASNGKTARMQCFPISSSTVCYSCLLIEIVILKDILVELLTHKLPCNTLARMILSIHDIDTKFAVELSEHMHRTYQRA